MSWWQKKLLHYALSHIGVLDEEAIKPENLNLQIGRRNVIELRDVGLNKARISALAELPPGIEIRTAKILLLRLSIPADIYKSSIVAEVDGIDVSVDLSLTETQADQSSTKRDAEATPVGTSTSNRRHSFARQEQGHESEQDDDGRIPTTQELARSFLLEETVAERAELQASVAASNLPMEDSFYSEDSESDNVGTGTAVGLPGFLAGFLQGIVDRFQVNVGNVEVVLNLKQAPHMQLNYLTAIRLRIKAVISGAVTKEGVESRGGGRLLQVEGVTLDLLSGAASIVPSRAGTQILKLSPTDLSTQQPVANNHASPAVEDPAVFDSHRPQEQAIPVHLIDEDTEEDFGIKAGDDNVSWASRKENDHDDTAEDLWRDAASDDDLHKSLNFEPAFSPMQQENRPDFRQRRTVSPYERRLHSMETWPLSSERHAELRLEHSNMPLPSVTHQQTLEDAFSGDAFQPASNEQNNMPFAETEQSQYLEWEPNDQDQTANPMLESAMSNSDNSASIYYSMMPDESGGYLKESQHTFISPSNHDKSRSEQSLQTTIVENRDPDVPETGTDNDTSFAKADNRSPIITPRVHSPAPQRHAREDSCRQILTVDNIRVWIMKPATVETSGDAVPSIVSTKQVESLHQDSIPGAFSSYYEGAQSRAMMSFSNRNIAFDSETRTANPSAQRSAYPSLKIEIGQVSLDVDMQVGRMIVPIVKPMKNLLTLPAKKPHTNASPQSNEQGFDIAITWKRLKLNVRADEAALAFGDAVEPPPLMGMTISDISANSCLGESRLAIGCLLLCIGGKEMFTFETHSISPVTSGKHEIYPQIQVRHKFNTFAVASNRQINEVYCETTPIIVNVDVQVIEEVLKSLGGLAGILELASIIQDPASPAAIPAKVARGVRFEAPAAAESVEHGPELKVNARINGLKFKLQCTAGGVAFDVSTIKAVYREQGAKATVERVRLSGPYISNAETGAPLSVTLSGLKIDYSAAPRDADLERLLSLLTPSKDKYDNDDDILVDTLLRQRRKGAIARILVDDLVVACEDLLRLASLGDIGQELTKLSAVAKYLPQDDRPGPLTLFKINTVNVKVPVNAKFGILETTLQSIDLAHVGLPALFAFSVADVTVRRSHGEDIVHFLLPPASVDYAPVLMARMLGDEEEPTVKLKVFNICVEYSVPLLLDLMNLEESKGEEDIVNDMVQSVANLASLGMSRSKVSSRLKDEQSSSKTKINLVILLHDTAFGLSPHGLSAKAAVIVTSAKIAAPLPVAETVTVKLELDKAALWITDNAIDGVVETAPRLLSNTTTSTRVAGDLCRRGYVSIGSIMSAKIDVTISQPTLEEPQTVEVDIQNELFLLETCADSTQTMIAIFGALGPPKSPVTEPAYLTEPMTIADMMASFSGDAFPPASSDVGAGDVLFDVENESSDELEDPDAFFMGQSLAQEDLEIDVSEPASSIYEPPSALDDQFDRGDDQGLWADTAESLLEEDPFVMTIAPADETLSADALLRDLRKQCKPVIEHQTCDLGYNDLDTMMLAQDTNEEPSLGWRFKRKPKLPVEIRARNMHVIWNIHDGFDWKHTREEIAEAVEHVEAQAEERKLNRRRSHNADIHEEPVIADFLFNSIYIGIPSNHDPDDLRRQINRGINDLASETETTSASGFSRQTSTTLRAGQAPIRESRRRRLKLERSRTHKIAFELKGLSADVSVYPPESGDKVSSIDVRLRDLEIFDNVPTSTWRKFLTLLNVEREMSKPMIHLEIDTVKTLKNFAAAELTIHASVLPLRLHVDQDALDFITRFFAFKDPAIAAPPSDPASQPFLQRIEVDTVDLRLDYKPKRIDYVGLRSGHTTEFMNFITLEGTNIRLKHAIVYGLRGFEPLHKTLNDVWMPDVRSNQLPTVLAGLAPVRGLVNLGSGVRDVVAIPIREYRKDGRIVRSIQKGAFEFGKTTASELARLGAKVAVGTQNLLQGAEGLLTPGAEAGASPRHVGALEARMTAERGWQEYASQAADSEEHHAISAYADQPLGVIAGLQSARRRLEYDLLTARDALIAVQGEILESSSPGAAAAAVARHAPTVLLRPVIGASRAISTTLLGVGNQFDRDNVRRTDDKYKRR